MIDMDQYMNFRQSRKNYNMSLNCRQSILSLAHRSIEKSDLLEIELILYLIYDWPPNADNHILDVFNSNQGVKI